MALVPADFNRPDIDVVELFLYIFIHGHKQEVVDDGEVDVQGVVDELDGLAQRCVRRNTDTALKHNRLSNYIIYL